jgi:hypothetical protein
MSKPEGASTEPEKIRERRVRGHSVAVRMGSAEPSDHNREDITQADEKAADEKAPQAETGGAS